jgi:hypothetical protein
MEDLSPIISGLAGGGIAVLVYGWASRSPETLKAGVLKFGKRLKLMWVAILAIGCVLAYAAYRSAEGQEIAAYGVGGGALVIGIAGVLDVFLSKFVVREESLLVCSPWIGKKSVPWEAIEDVEYSDTFEWYIIRTTGYGKIRLPENLLGVEPFIDDLLEAIEDRSGREKQVQNNP